MRVVGSLFPKKFEGGDIGSVVGPCTLDLEDADKRVCVDMGLPRRICYNATSDIEHVSVKFKEEEAPREVLFEMCQRSVLLARIKGEVRQVQV